MKKLATLLVAVVATGLFMLASAPANAQATRTWVSGVGDDANPCSRTAPCKTFAGAISKTAVSGEINCLDPGGYGAVTITKAITIDCTGTQGSVLVSGTNGIVVNAGTAKVVLRNLEIQGLGTGINGVNVLAAGEVIVDKCRILGFTGNAINVAVSATTVLYVNETDITQSARGVNMNTTAGFAVGSVNNSQIYGMSTAGVSTTSNNAVLEVIGSVFTNNGTAVLTSGGNGIISVSNSLLTQNATAFNAGAGSTIRITGNKIFDNPTGFVGTIASGADNKTGGNGGAGAPGGGVGTQ